MRTLFRASDRLYHTTKETFFVVECAKCRLLRLFPWPNPERLRHYYPDDYWYVPGEDTVSRLLETYRRFVASDHVRFADKAIRSTRQDGLVLDVGCGGGLLLRMLAERGHRVLGLDFSLTAAVAAWRMNGVPAVCATLPCAPLAEQSCSAITMYHVLEHLYEPAVYIEMAHRLLKPDGRLIVQVPNAACWQFLLFGDSWNGLDVPRHLINYRAGDLELLLDHCGFEVVRRKFFSLRDNPAGFASSLAPSLDPMARRIRQVRESPAMALCKDLAYLGLTVAAVPFTLIEAACRQGSTIMVEARKKA